MKNVLFASTALVAFGFAGAAFAEAHSSTSITLSGMGEIGITSTDNDSGGANTDGELELHNDVDLRWALVGMTDGGISFGANIDWDEAPNEEDASVFISGSFGTITVGDTDSAYESAMIEIATGGIVDEAAFYESEYDEFTGAGDSEGQTGRYDIAFGGTTLSLSYENGNDTGVAATTDDEVYGIGASFTFGTVDLGLGYITQDDDEIAGISAGFDLGQAGLVIAYQDGEIDGFDAQNIQGSVTVDFGGGTLGANYVVSEEDDAVGTNDQTAYGLFYNYSLGGGATFTAAAGYEELEDSAGVTTEDTRFGAGISMAF
ncbi:porin [Pontivivens nitratireducens]|uniref:Porin n=1 Tax=Pontivivens nitratireducens TaxID=2758038 RepID=A0A6G7VHV4_9RHOB|nr:porin [Pontibrevibacter nitratireducens]QIK39456.1 porin [Pontibrevibacter nitratireducens]